jgi:hypothetical protein
VVANARAENQNQDRLSTVNRELSAKAKAMDSLRRVGLDSEPTAVRDDAGPGRVGTRAHGIAREQTGSHQNLVYQQLGVGRGVAERGSESKVISVVTVMIADRWA